MRDDFLEITLANGKTYKVFSNDLGLEELEGYKEKLTTYIEFYDSEIQERKSQIDKSGETISEYIYVSTGKEAMGVIRSASVENPPENLGKSRILRIPANYLDDVKDESVLGVIEHEIGHLFNGVKYTSLNLVSFVDKVYYWLQEDKSGKKIKFLSEEVAQINNDFQDLHSKWKDFSDFLSVKQIYGYKDLDLFNLLETNPEIKNELSSKLQSFEKVLEGFCKKYEDDKFLKYTINDENALRQITPLFNEIFSFQQSQSYRLSMQLNRYEELMSDFSANDFTSALKEFLKTIPDTNPLEINSHPKSADRISIVEKKQEILTKQATIKLKSFIGKNGKGEVSEDQLSQLIEIAGDLVVYENKVGKADEIKIGNQTYNISFQNDDVGKNLKR